MIVKNALHLIIAIKSELWTTSNYYAIWNNMSSTISGISLWSQSYRDKCRCLANDIGVPRGATRVVDAMYRQIANIRGTLVGNTIVVRSDVAEASPVDAAAITSSFSTWHRASTDWEKTTVRRNEKHLSYGIWCDLYKRFDGIFSLGSLDQLQYTMPFVSRSCIWSW